MKKSLHFFLFAGIISFNTMAQPVITSGGINPVIGESISTNSTSYISPGSSGAGQTWNLSAMSVTSSQTSNVVATSSTPNGASFPNSNLAYSNSGGTYSYFKTSATGWQNYGSYTSVVMVYSNPEDIVQFPFAYTNSYTDAWAATFNSGGYLFYRTGTSTATADGYGTLITPAGTFNNVLRVHFYQDYKDSTDLGGFPYEIYYQNDEYMWYQEGTHYPLATVYNLTTSSGGPYTGGSYVTPLATGILGTAGKALSFDAAPNPVSDNLTIAANLIAIQKVTIRIFNSIGSEVKVAEERAGVIGQNLFFVNVNDLPNGVYFAQLCLDNVPASIKKIVVSK